MMVVRAGYTITRALVKRRQILKNGTKEDKIKLNDYCIDKPHVWSSINTIFDTDMHLHMNNAAYVRCAELARWAYATERGLFNKLLKRMFFIVASQHFVYRAPIPFMSRYEVHSRIGLLDDKWIILRQTFVRPKTHKKGFKVYADGIIKAIIKDRTGKLNKKEALFKAFEISESQTEAMKWPQNMQIFFRK